MCKYPIDTAVKRAHLIRDIKSGIYCDKDQGGNRIVIILKNRAGMTVITHSATKPSWCEYIEYNTDGDAVRIRYKQLHHHQPQDANQIQAVAAQITMSFRYQELKSEYKRRSGEVLSFTEA